MRQTFSYLNGIYANIDNDFPVLKLCQTESRFQKNLSSILTKNSKDFQEISDINQKLTLHECDQLTDWHLVNYNLEKK